MSIEQLLDPRSIAIVGASPRNHSALAIHENLRRSRFGGTITLVSRNHQAVHGTECVQSLAHCATTPDVAIIALGPEASVDALESAAACGVGAAIVLSDGFAEAGPDGLQRQARITATARRAGVTLCGPNSMGVINNVSGVPMWLSTLSEPPRRGRVAALMQSGAIANAVLNARSGLGFSHLVSTGNEATFGVDELLAQLATAGDTDVIMVQIESVRCADVFLAAIESARAASKHVIVLKLGASAAGRRAIAGHSGRVVGSDLVARRLMVAAGAVVVDSVEHFVHAALLASLRITPSPTCRYGVITISGGYSSLAADRMEHYGHQAPAVLEPTTNDPGEPMPNFIDVWNNGDFLAAFEQAVDSYDRSPSTEITMVVHDLPSTPITGGGRTVDALTSSLCRSATSRSKPLVWCDPLGGSTAPELVDRLVDGGVPVLSGLDATLAALAQLGASSPRRASARPPLSHALRQARTWTEHAAKSWLEQRGLQIPRGALVNEVAGATRCANALGYPVVLKGQSEEIQHKQAAGLVSIGLASDDAVIAEHRRIVARASSSGITLVGVLVEEHVDVVVELMLTGLVDPTFGPVVYLGPGGSLAERATGSVAQAPLDLPAARSLVAQAVELPTLAREEIATTVQRFSSIVAAAHDDVDVIEINPLVVTRSGDVVVVDALVAPSQPPQPDIARVGSTSSTGGPT